MPPYFQMGDLMGAGDFCGLLVSSLAELFAAPGDETPHAAAGIFCTRALRVDSCCCGCNTMQNSCQWLMQ